MEIEELERIKAKAIRDAENSFDKSMAKAGEEYYSATTQAEKELDESPTTSARIYRELKTRIRADYDAAVAQAEIALNKANADAEEVYSNSPVTSKRKCEAIKQAARRKYEETRAQIQEAHNKRSIEITEGKFETMEVANV